MKTIKIGKQLIGINQKPYFIADIAANHDGDLTRAYKLIELAKESGANAAKFQNFKANTIVSCNGFKSMNSQLAHQKNWNDSVYDVYRKASIPDEWSQRLKEKCDSVGIEYITSPYDLNSVDIANHYCNCFKIGSGDVTWTEIVDYIAKKHKPVIIATGACEMSDVTRAMNTIMQSNSNIILMQCNTNYTASSDNFQHINLNVLKDYAARFPDVILGLSDHTFGSETVLGAIALGARVIEKHFTDDNNRIGPDHKFSMNPISWKSMVDSSNHLFEALGDGVKRIQNNERETAIVQRRALYLVKDMKCGEIITEQDVFPLRPFCIGNVPPYQKSEIIGKRLLMDIKADTAVKWSDFV